MPLKSKYLGLERKDFLSLSASAVAIGLSAWVIVSQYIESSIKEGKQHRQMLYVTKQIGKNLAAAFIEKNLPNFSSMPIIAAELSALGIPIQAKDLSLESELGKPSWDGGPAYSNASFFKAFEQIKDLLDAHYGQDAVKMFTASYYLTLAQFAIGAKDDQRGNDTICGVWIVDGSRVYEKIKGTYNLPHIEPQECQNDLVGTSIKLDAAVKRLEQALESRTPLFGSTSK